MQINRFIKCVYLHRGIPLSEMCVYINVCKALRKAQESHTLTILKQMKTTFLHHSVDDLFIQRICTVPITPFGIFVCAVCVCVCERGRDGESKSLGVFAHYSFLCRGEMAVFSCYVIKTSTLVKTLIFLWKCHFT